MKMGFPCFGFGGFFGVWFRLAKPGIRPLKCCHFTRPAGQEMVPAVTHGDAGAGCFEAVGRGAKPGRSTAGNATGSL